MILSATNTLPNGSTYAVLRHLFSEAMESSTGDKRWSFYGSHTDPGNEIATEYVHEFTGDRIRCVSSDYDGKTYRHQWFTFRPADVTANESTTNTKRDER